MKNKKYLNVDELITEEVVNFFKDAVSDPVKIGEGSYQYNIELPPDYIIENSKPETFTIEDLQQMIQDIRWEEKRKPKDTAVVYTGIEGRVNYQEQLVKYVGGTFTEEDRDKYRQELIKSGQTIFKL